MLSSLQLREWRQENPHDRKPARNQVFGSFLARQGGKMRLFVSTTAIAAAHALVVSRRVVRRTRLPAAVDAKADSTTTAELKKALLRAVGENRGERDILDAAAVLEAQNMRTAPVSGRWALVFSTQTARPSDSAAKSIADLPQEVSNAIYSVLFKVAPFLAGGQERRQKAFSVANEQNVDEAAGTVDNRVTLTVNGPLGKQKIDIRVFGTVRSTDDEDTLEIIFEGFELGLLPTIPLPRPVGRIVTTFVDGDLRLSRGSRGGLFVLKRIR